MQIIVSLNGLSLSIKNKFSRTYAVTAPFLTKLHVSSLKKETKVHLLFFLSVDGKMKKKSLLQTNVIQFSVYFAFN